MKKSNTILPILQTVLTPEEVDSIVQAIGYVDKSRKFTVYHLLQYWCAAASEEWSGYRFGADSVAPNSVTVWSSFVILKEEKFASLPT